MSNLYRIPDLILKKRNGHELNKDEIDFFIKSICDSNNNAIQESQIGIKFNVPHPFSRLWDSNFRGYLVIPREKLKLESCLFN